MSRSPRFLKIKPTEHIYFQLCTIFLGENKWKRQIKFPRGDMKYERTWITSPEIQDKYQ